VPDIEREGFERSVEAGAVQAHGAETVRQVMGLADGLVQEFVDVGGRSRRDEFGARSQLFRRLCLR
jgi:hypothetical protein